MKRALLLLAIAVPAFADRFNVTFEGKPVSRAEVCATRAGDLASPLTRFLTGGAMTCYAANGEIRLPPGAWNVFARRADDLISDAAVIAGDSKPHDLALVRAARVEHGEKGLYAYVVGTGALIPVDTTVPATRIVPLLVAGGRIRAIGTAVTPEPGKSVRFEFANDPAGKGSVVVPVATLSKTDVTLAGAKQRADSALLFFRGVPAGSQQIAFGGRQRTVKVEAGQIAIAEPLVLGSMLRIHWWTPVALASLAQPERACGKKTEAPAKALAKLELLQCPNRCTVVAERPFPTDAVKGVVELPDVSAGSYVVRVTHPGLPPFSRSIVVPPEEPDIEIRYVTFFGKVTRGGKPLHVRLFGTVTDPETGDYTAVMTRLPAAGVPEEIEPCDGGRAIRIVSDDPPVENARYDITVPENRLVVRVVDAESRAPIEKAVINMAALEKGKDEAAHFAGPAGQTDAEGKFVVESIVANKRLNVCASRQDYENACADRFEFGSEREKTIEIGLRKAVARQGRVVLGGPQQFASIDWYSLDGRLTETTLVKDDGSFTFKRTHPAGEIVCYSSANQPFIVVRQSPLRDDEVFEIRPPIGARLRSFQIALSPDARDNAYATIALGDVIVPLNPFAAHVARHGAQSSLRPGWVMNVPDIVESAPIRVILIPFSFAFSHDVPGIDFAMHPEVHSLPQQLLGERARVDFQ